MDLQWDDLRIFLAVADAGSLSGAARRLKASQPTLSRRIAEMEYALGEPLFIRKNQGIALTKTGARLLPAAQGMAQWATEANRAVDAKNSAVSGRVRIAAVPAFAFDFLPPIAEKLKRKHPQITLEVLAGTERLNLARGEADIALRRYPSDDPDLITVDEVAIPIGAYASRDYARRLPARYDFRDLHWIAWAGELEMVSPNPEFAARIPDFRPAFTSDDYSVQVAACHAGVGAMILLKTSHRIKRPGELVELKLVLPTSLRAAISIICHKRMVDLPKVRTVVDLLRQEFADLRKSQGSS
ncbi:MULTISPECIES: LysR family transcriptional regulator [unclassified Bradyrhizobium]|uniref:LysR family transcriptional regulator n=1 Tax=unclassified Bradyrhizobium TaxID=2631580 RepID=UPI0020B219F8|nr:MULTISPECIES: LysR family transcriptional regulator [unclassified Bradyrhizobium]MCP3385887.1 LysR family transcriptional regulator [Bradyrhizobium sp. CCGUVB4N]MCP3447151.1 LysR family transcriptional regulator [Bradyrhizobium sp. CCGUVB14]